jgi:hypothetical protein
MNWLSESLQWLAIHPVCLAGICLAIGAAISIFSGDIRRFLSIQPQRLSVWVLRTRLLSTAVKVQRLKVLNADLKQMLVHFVFHLGQLALVAIVLLLTLTGEGIMQRMGAVHSRGFNIFDLSMLCVESIWGTAVAVTLFQSIIQLLSYSETIKRLEAKKERLTARLVQKMVSKQLPKKASISPKA